MHTISWERAQRVSRPVLASRPAPAVLVRCAAATVVALLLGGVLSGLLWSWLADPPLAQVGNRQVFTGGVELTRQFGMDVTFAWTAALPALPIGALAGAPWHRHGWVQAVAVAVGGIAAGLVAWGVGSLLGPGDLRERVATAAVGDQLPNALVLDSHGLLLSAAVSALIGFVLAVALSDTGELEPESSGPAEIADSPRVAPPAG